MRERDSTEKRTTNVDTSFKKFMEAHELCLGRKQPKESMEELYKIYVDECAR